MYNVKVNGNYNIIIEDLGLKLDASSNVTITEKQYQNSNDLKKLFKYLKVEKIEENSMESEFILEADENNEKTNVFVAHYEEVVNPEGAFIKDVNIMESENLVMDEYSIKDKIDKESAKKPELTESIKLEDENISHIKSPIDPIVPPKKVEQFSNDIVIEAEKKPSKTEKAKTEKKKPAKNKPGLEIVDEKKDTKKNKKNKKES